MASRWDGLKTTNNSRKQDEQHQKQKIIPACLNYTSSYNRNHVIVRTKNKNPRYDQHRQTQNLSSTSIASINSRVSNVSVQNRNHVPATGGDISSYSAGTTRTDCTSSNGIAVSASRYLSCLSSSSIRRSHNYVKLLKNIDNPNCIDPLLTNRRHQIKSNAFDSKKFSTTINSSHEDSEDTSTQFRTKKAQHQQLNDNEHPITPQELQPQNPCVNLQNLCKLLRRSINTYLQHHRQFMYLSSQPTPVILNLHEHAKVSCDTSPLSTTSGALEDVGTSLVRLQTAFEEFLRDILDFTSKVEVILCLKRPLSFVLVDDDTSPHHPNSKSINSKGGSRSELGAIVGSALYLLFSCLDITVFNCPFDVIEIMKKNGEDEDSQSKLGCYYHDDNGDRDNGKTYGLNLRKDGEKDIFNCYTNTTEAMYILIKQLMEWTRGDSRCDYDQNNYGNRVCISACSQHAIDRAIATVIDSGSTAFFNHDTNKDDRNLHVHGNIFGGAQRVGISTDCRVMSSKHAQDCFSILCRIMEFHFQNLIDGNDGDGASFTCHANSALQNSFLTKGCSSNTDESKTLDSRKEANNNNLYINLHTRTLKGTGNIDVQQHHAKSLQTALECARSAIQTFGNEFSAEECVGSAVQSIILPILESEPLLLGRVLQCKKTIEKVETLSSTARDRQFTELMAIQTAIRIKTVECIIQFLQWKKHASAMLAPLVVDVSITGKESLGANHLRERLLRCLEDILIRAHGDDIIDNSSCMILGKDKSRTSVKRIRNDASMIIACNCLTILLENIYAIEKSQSSQGKSRGTNVRDKTKEQDTNGLNNRNNVNCTPELNVTSVMKWIHKSIQRERLKKVVSNDEDEKEKEMLRFRRLISLKLLRSIAAVYPKAASLEWALFFPQSLPITTASHTKARLPSMQNIDAVSSTRHRSDINLLSFISSEENDAYDDYETVVSSPNEDERILAITACKELLSALPLRLWLSSLCQKRVGKGGISVGHFGSRVKTSLMQIVECVSLQVHRCCVEHTMVELCYLTKVIITTIPFDYDDDGTSAGTGILVGPAEILLQTVANRLVQGGVDGISRSFVRGSKAWISMAQVLGDCMGGIETPQGTLTPLPLPTRKWLNSTDVSGSFVSHIFDSLMEIDSHEVASHDRTLGIEKINLFLRMVQMVTWVVLVGDRQNIFLGVIRRLGNSTNHASIRLFGVKMLLAFFQGKRNYSFEESHKLYTINEKRFLFLSCALHSYLRNFLKDHDNSVRCCALSAYGLLQISDWNALLSEEDDTNHFTIILSLCLEYSGEADGSVRGEACKAVGNIITECMGNKDKVFYSLNDSSPTSRVMKKKIYGMIENSIQVAASAIEDSNPGVRCMALFAIGNTAVAISDYGVDNGLLQKLPLVLLCESVYKRLDDKNDKVIGNAIRTIGHLFHLLHDCHININLRKDDLKEIKRMCGVVAKNLAGKIELALSDVFHSSSQQRSWKQRSHAKKHAWGACHSLAYILDSFDAREGKNREDIQCALHQMIRCVASAHELNEKIALGAVSTLQGISKELWPEDGDFKSLCLSACLIQAYKNDKNISKTPKLFKEAITALMKNMLYFATIDDIVSCFKQSDTSQSTIDFLYNWMVENESDYRCFEWVGKAVLSSNIDVDISLVQKFTSRALYEQRKEHLSLPGLDPEPGDSLKTHNETQDEDEL